MKPRRSRILLLALPALLLTALGTAVSADLLWPAASPVLGALMAALLLVGYARMTLAASATLLGCVARPDRAVPAGTGDPPRTALLVPIFNEPPEPVAVAVRVMADALAPEDGITIFVLSDTADTRLIASEAALFPAQARAASGVCVRYRRRPLNTGRKAGNIAEFCHGAGRDFDFAIVLDADSLMTAPAIRALVAALDADPRAALIQSVTYPVGAETLFGRMQQFAARLNTPLTVAGQHLWEQGRGTFWGHNAVLRLAPFTAHARLPVLPGRPPMGGELLCHDTIEAALLLRAGWEARMAPAIAGSYETTPTNLVDHLARERRWCQGNLQHLRLLAAPGYRPESRLHILIGILHYASAPASLLLACLLFASPGRHAPASAAAAATTLWLTLALLFGPRLASLCRALARPDAARRFGGRPALVASAFVEQAVTTLTAPILMLSVTAFVAATLAGLVVRWDAPPRGDRAVGWREAVRRFRWHTAVAAASTLAICLLRPASLFWLLPLVAGPLLSIPLAVASGSVRLGVLARRFGLFRTEDELDAPAELAAFSRRDAVPTGQTLAAAAE